MSHRAILPSASVTASAPGNLLTPLNTWPACSPDSPLADSRMHDAMHRPIVGTLTGGFTMKLCCGIDLHSNNHVITIIDEQDRRVYERRLPNDITMTLRVLEPYRF